MTTSYDKEQLEVLQCFTNVQMYSILNVLLSFLQVVLFSKIQKISKMLFKLNYNFRKHFMHFCNLISFRKEH